MWAMAIAFMLYAIVINYAFPGCSSGGCGEFDSTTGEYEKPPPPIRQTLAGTNAAAGLAFFLGFVFMFIDRVRGQPVGRTANVSPHRPHYP